MNYFYPNNDDSSMVERSEFNAEGLLYFAAASARSIVFPLCVLGILVMFGIGICVGIGLERQAPSYPPSPNICRSDELTRTDCIHPAPTLPTDDEVSGRTLR